MLAVKSLRQNQEATKGEADIGDVAVALLMDGRLIGAAGVQVVVADKLPTTAERPMSPSPSTSSPARPNSTARRSSMSPTRRSRNISRIFPASKAITNRAARRWCACAMARACPRAIRRRSTCCGSSAAAAMRSGTSRIPRNRRCSRASIMGLKDTQSRRPRQVSCRRTPLLSSPVTDYVPP